MDIGDTQLLVQEDIGRMWCHIWHRSRRHDDDHCHDSLGHNLFGDIIHGVSLIRNLRYQFQI